MSPSVETGPRLGDAWGGRTLSTRSSSITASVSVWGAAAPDATGTWLAGADMRGAAMARIRQGKASRSALRTDNGDRYGLALQGRDRCTTERTGDDYVYTGRCFNRRDGEDRRGYADSLRDRLPSQLM